MYHAWVILRQDLRSLLSYGQSRDIKHRLKIFIAVLFFAAYMCGFAYGAFRLFSYVRESLSVVPGLSNAVAANALNAATAFVLVMMILNGLQISYKTTYESDDIAFLLAQPVPAKSVFVAKLVAGWVNVLALAASFSLPAWFGYAYANKLGTGFYLQAVLGLSTLILLGYSAISLLCLVAMKKLSGRKMKQLFIASAAIFGVLVVLGSQVLSSQVARTENPSVILEQLARSGLSKAWYLPSTWMTNAVLGSVSEFGADPGPYWIALIASATGLTALAVHLSGTLYLEGWAGRNVEASTSRAKRSRAGIRRDRITSFSSLRGTYWAVLRKDLTLLFRDPLLWYNLVVAVIVLGFFLLNSRHQFRATGSREQELMVGSLLIMMSTLMGSIAGVQTGGISLSREGSAFWLIRSNPADPSRLFWSKATYALLPPAVLIMMFLPAAKAIGLPQLPLWLACLLGLSMTSVVGFVQILLDLYFPDFSMKLDFGSSKTGRGSGKLLIAMFVSMGLVFFMFSLFAFPQNLSKDGILPLSQETVYRISSGVVIAMGILAWILGSYLGKQRMSKLLRDI